MGTGIIGGILATAIFGLVTSIIKRSRRGKFPEAAAYFGTIARVFTGMVAAMSVALFGLVVFLGAIGNPTATWWIHAILGGVAIVGVGMFYDSFLRRVEWAETTLRMRKWSGERTMPWTDVISIDEKSFPSYTRINFCDGSGFAITELMTGYDSFVRAADYRGIPYTEDGRPVSR